MTGIAVESLSKSFAGVPALSDVNFTVEEGEMVSMLGPSGCGKTTTLRCIAGLEHGDSGTITIRNRLVSDFSRSYYLAPDRRDIGMVFQSYAIWPHMTVEKNVAYPLLMRGLSKAEVKSAVLNALSLVGMTEFADRSATKLSGGQQQRVAVARALVARPGVLLFDEPLSNLDAKLRDHTRHELRQIQKSLGVTGVYVTHDQAEAMAISDRIVVMNAGRIEQVGTPIEVYRAPVTAFVAGFVGSTNFIQLRKTGAKTDGLLEGKLENGQHVRFPDRNVNTDSLLVSVRPQFCRVEDPKTPVPDAYNALSGTISRMTFFGERYEASVDLQNIGVTCYLPLDTSFQPGSPVNILFLPEDSVPLQE